MRAVILAAVVVTVAFAPVALSAPAVEDVDIELNLEGVATQTSAGSNAYSATMNVSGEGTRKTPNGNGVQIKATDVEAKIVIVSTETGDEVANFTLLVNFHAQQASAIAQGLPQGNFKFNLELAGKRSEHTVAQNQTSGRILAMNAQGDTNGASDDDGFFAVTGQGKSTSKPSAGGTTHFNIVWGGEGRIQTSG
ncbi:MAG: hypothetical protein HYT80_00240 [Euryarchaeota archaeon]|nr:hypothetical protein [Euryarchaeota archaeon]